MAWMTMEIFKTVGNSTRATEMAERHRSLESSNPIQKQQFFESVTVALELEDLPKLRSFSQRKHDLHFPSLEVVKIRDCSEMQTFAQGYISTPKLRELEINREPFPVNDINNSIRQHFGEKQHANEEEITSEEEVDEEIEITEEVAEQITTEE